jgi:hypothetical protein
MNNQEILDNALIGIEWEPQFALPNYSGYQICFENNFFNGTFITIKRQVDSKGVPLLASKHDPFYSPKRVTVVVSVVQFGKFIDKISKEISKPLCLNDKKDTKKSLTKELTKLMGIDGTNFEIRTIPSSFKQLTNNIAIADSLLFLFIEKLNRCISGGVGVFLPKTTIFEASTLETLLYSTPRISIPTKHINITFNDMPIHDNYWSYGRLLDAKFFITKISLKQRKLSSPKRLHITVPYNFTDYGNLIKVAYPMYQKMYDGCPSRAPKYTNVDITEQYNDIIKYLDDWAQNNPMNSPILLKYIKKKRLVNLRSLI